MLLIGHGSFDGKTAAFNLPGPDLPRPTTPSCSTSFRRSGSCSSTPAARAAPSPGRSPVRRGPSSRRRRPAASATRRASRSSSSRRSQAKSADRDRNGRVSVLEAFDYAKNRVAATYEQGGHILTEHATLDDGSEGKLAATQFLAPPRSRSAEMANADPALRALRRGARRARARRSRSCGCGRIGWTQTRVRAGAREAADGAGAEDRAIRELEAKK